ncbi:transglycosylase SLT domain-containing protein [Spirulina subsalsa]|uniref:transglycosylase SLT domain-containing protein n=1 Tax=Spirulina subsalsa TaxID=54311 RepID=UPI0002ED1D4E|nr:transglycosylase SLT domain-containing protein [Spirulina subsalsa]
MLKGRTIQTVLTVSSGFVIVGLVGATVFVGQQQGWLTQLERWVMNTTGGSANLSRKPTDEKSEVLPLALLPMEERLPRLEELANGAPSYERSRARLILASDWIQQGEGGRAIRTLDGLELDYPLLGPWVLLKRARAYELTNDLNRSRDTLQKLLESYPESLAVGEALYNLGRYDEEYWERAIAEHPQHPLTHQLVREKLEGNRDQPELLLFLAHNTPDSERMSEIRDYLVQRFSDQLTPEDWEVIGFGYWQQWEYGKAASAYSRAPRTPETLFRTARGREIAGNNIAARIDYQQLVSEFPDSREAGQALLRLAASSPPQEAIAFLDQAIANYPDHAAEALINKANILEQQGARTSAAQARQSVLSQHPQSEAASRYRWERAKAFSSQGNYIEAWRWARPIAINTPNSSLAPRAAFWVGKWASRVNRTEDAESAYQYVLEQHPESYYAWRSAVLLGWDVGDFTTVRPKNPEIVTPAFYPHPPAGSEAFRELYQLGQYNDAWKLWQAEIGNRRDKTVDEQFTQGLILQTQGKYLDGINAIWNLTQRNAPEEREEWQALRQESIYWETLFPLPYSELILEWSEARTLNPFLVFSLIRQESRFEKEIRSSAGALGLMQVMPDTGRWIAEQISLENYSLINPADNIKLGTWYLDYTHQRYNNNSLLAIASYNAGPGNVNQWVQRYGFDDPDVFVEQIPFPETKGYVESVFSNYWNYLRIYNPEIAQLMQR